MKARVFFDAFAECLVAVSVARRYPGLMGSSRTVAVTTISGRHGVEAGESTGRMFDRLWHDMQIPGASK